MAAFGVEALLFAAAGTASGFGAYEFIFNDGSSFVYKLGSVAVATIAAAIGGALGRGPSTVGDNIPKKTLKFAIPAVVAAGGVLYVFSEFELPLMSVLGISGSIVAALLYSIHLSN